MASNKNALIRYKTIDLCLRNTMRKWTLQDLIDACSDALYEYEGKDVYVSKRTVQLDIQMMRSDKLGYNAPIEVYQRKYYHYTEEGYSIMNIPVTENDVRVMNDAIQVLRQFKDFSLFKEMDGVLQRLEDSVYSKQKNKRAIIHLDKNEQLKGLHFIDSLYNAIQKKQVLEITYKSFKARKESLLIVHPQLLKEFNNRWFLIVYHKTEFMNLALDRIVTIKEKTEFNYVDKNINGDEYFKNVIGVTVSNSRVRKVEFWIEKRLAPYVITKPFHHTQRLIRETDNWIVFHILVQINFELERLLLSYGNSIKVTKPLSLQNRIKNQLKEAYDSYL
ncbi:WYL domain-containing protein [Tenacibaculum tangerinum]|uniref:WYL domain-containing protein n=1 Tax=Tenacibaculum tangerinum TaxID=3038772 RepID=A0ABY8L8J5_9FLAO|nr:WYL domain-containing protein [Tenacibaculum tangerinum]WGH76454.1 WYL domain-containing protein [Tenacibaculum tangerinum]